MAMVHDDGLMMTMIVMISSCLPPRALFPTPEVVEVRRDATRQEAKGGETGEVASPQALAQKPAARASISPVPEPPSARIATSLHQPGRGTTAPCTPASEYLLHDPPAGNAVQIQKTFQMTEQAP